MCKNCSKVWDKMAKTACSGQRLRGQRLGAGGQYREQGKGYGI